MRSHNMTGQPKTGDQLLEVVKEDLNYMETHYGLRTIAWCTDDGPDGKKMRRLLWTWLPWMVVLVCWAHQINLVVGDLLSLEYIWLDVVEQAIELVVWFNNHSQPLSWLRMEQIQTYHGQSWGLFLPVATRWLAHYLTISRLLKIETAVRSCHIKYGEQLIRSVGSKAEKKAKATRVLKPIGDESFWRRLE